MKKTVFFGLLFAVCSWSPAQQMYRLTIDQHQVMENRNTSAGNIMKLPVQSHPIILGSLNELDGLGDYFNMFGNRLIVDSLDITPDGSKNIVLRREDGRDFYNLFPTLTARLTPMTSAEEETPFME